MPRQAQEFLRPCSFWVSCYHSFLSFHNRHSDCCKIFLRGIGHGFHGGVLISVIWGNNFSLQDNISVSHILNNGVSVFVGLYNGISAFAVLLLCLSGFILSVLFCTQFIPYAGSSGCFEDSGNNRLTLVFFPSFLVGLCN